MVTAEKENGRFIKYNFNLMSTTIVSVIINLLSVVLPLIGIQIGSDSLTTTIQTIVAIVTGLWIWKERIGRGDVNIVGMKKN